MQNVNMLYQNVNNKSIENQELIRSVCFFFFFLLYLRVYAFNAINTADHLAREEHCTTDLIHTTPKKGWPLFGPSEVKI